MANKLYNSHLKEISEQCKGYNTLDIYIILVYLSHENKNGHFIISNYYAPKKSDLIHIVKKYIKSVDYKTIFNNINKLIDMKILAEKDEGWQILDMEKMVKSKPKSVNNNDDDIDDEFMLTGYTNIREFFLSEDFHKMNIVEKKLMVFMARITDSKASEKYGNKFQINLLRSHSRWLEAINIKSVYYAKYKINQLLDKHHDLFEDKSQENRTKILYGSKKNNNFRFAFLCNIIKKVKTKAEQDYEIIKAHCSEDLAFIKDKIKFFEITLSTDCIIKIIHCISKLRNWTLKEEIINRLFNKYKAVQKYNSRKPIEHVSAYLKEIVEDVFTEYNNFKTALQIE